jgi:oxygen-independent coproporphyrinogen-3 oxidase
MASSRPPWIWPTAAYVHIPFCAFHCGYCDFAIAVGKDDRQDDYLRALEAELRKLEQPQSVRTISLGGGTPTHLSAQWLERLLTLLSRWLHLEPDGEYSIEANPANLDDDKIRVLADHGITRVSLGSQSFDRNVLRVLDRDHAPEDVPRAVDRVRRRIAAISLDLIFGAPGQTLDQWRNDLRQTLALEPKHLSTYGLTYETGTPLWKRAERGEVHPLGEEEELGMYETAIDTLEAAGFEHYEISNFARPGCRSQHNSVYWENHAHFGFGMGAAKYLEGTRSLNVRSLEGYLNRALAGQPTEFQSETLPPRERALETIGQNLRRAEGVNRVAFREQTGYDVDALVGPAVNRHVEWGTIAADEQGFRLTRRGKCVADVVIQDFWKPTLQEKTIALERTAR